MTPEDFFVQLANSLPFPYNLFAVFIIVIFIFLAKFYYTHNKNNADIFIESHSKQITIGLILIIISTAFLVAIYFVHENFLFPEPPEDRFIVAISPFNAVSPQGYSVDNYTPGKIKDEIEKVEGNTINVVILDAPPISNDKDAVQKGKKTGAHLVIYGGDQRVVTGETITEFYIISTNTSSTTPLFLDSNSSKKAVPVLYSDKSIRLESVEENVSSSVYTALAFEYYRKSEYISAVKMFKHIVNYKKEKTVLFYIGNCYSEISKFNQSLSNQEPFNKDLLNESLLYYNKSIEIDSNNWRAWNNKGNSLSKLGRYDEALKTYDKAIEIDPNSSLAWINKGNSLDSLGRYDEALKACDKAIEIGPNNSLAWYDKGYVLNDLGRYDEALKACDKAIEIAPQNSDAWNNKGHALNNLGRYDEALKAYDKAIEADSNNWRAWNNKGNSLDSLGRYDEALKAYDKSIAINSNNSFAWNNKGYVLNNLGKYDEALKACDKAIEIAPHDSSAWNNKGYALNNLGRYDEALKAYDEAIEIDPNSSLVWYNRACVFSLINDKEQAMSNLRHAIELDSSYKDIARTDSDFEELRTDEEFKKLVNSTN